MRPHSIQEGAIQQKFNAIEQEALRWLLLRVHPDFAGCYTAGQRQVMQELDPKRD